MIASNEQHEHHHTWEQRIEALFKGRLTQSEKDEVRAHVAGCAPCKQAYERFAKAEQALTPSHLISPYAKERVAERLLGATPAPRAASRWPVLVLGGVAACLLGVAMLPAVRDDASEPRWGELTPRGGGAALDSTQIGLRALAVVLGPDGAAQVSDLSDPNTVLPRQGNLRVLATSYGQARHVRLVLETSDGQQHVLVSDAALPAGAEDLKLDIPEGVAADWPQGAFRLSAIFAPAGVKLSSAPDELAEGQVLRTISGQLDGPDRAGPKR